MSLGGKLGQGSAAGHKSACPTENVKPLKGRPLVPVLGLSFVLQDNAHYVS